MEKRSNVHTLEEFVDLLKPQKITLFSQGPNQ